MTGLDQEDRAPGLAPAVASRGGAYLLLGAVILLWGANWPVMKVGLAYIPPFWFATIRLVMGAAALFAVLAATRRLALPTRHDLPLVLSVGLLQMAAFLALVNLALLHIGAGRSAVLAYTMPLWVAPGAILLLGERITRLKLAGLLLGFAGMVVLFNPFGFDWDRPEVALGNGLLMLAAIGWGAAILHIRGHAWRLSPLQIAPWQMLVAIPPLLALALWFEGDAPIRWSADLLAVLVYTGLVATAFCFWAVVTINRTLPAITTSLALLGVPAAGVAFSTLSLGEPLTSTLLAGFGLVLGGLALVNLADQARR